MGLIFVTAGERSVACGNAKALNLPEWAKLLAVRRGKVRRQRYRSPCGYEHFVLIGHFTPDSH
ncbi:MAG: hypothetical protein LBG92_00060 [Prevotellaceae bacterium]|jgi:hypothetical protein|nr:hypothetical protein [Prevotellaceae bacterium]